MLQDAFEYLCCTEAAIPEAHRLPATARKGNPFNRKHEQSPQELDRLYKEFNQAYQDFQNFDTLYAEKTGEYKNELYRLSTAAHMSNEDEQRFRTLLGKYPSLITINVDVTLNMGLYYFVLTKNGSSDFFKFLVSPPHKMDFFAHLILPLAGSVDIFSLSLLFNRIDCLKTLLDLFGLKAARSSFIDRNLSQIIVDNKDGITALHFLLEYGYRPFPLDLINNISSKMTDVLLNYIKNVEETEGSFQKLFALCVYLDELGYHIDYLRLLPVVIAAGHSKFLYKMDEKKWISPETSTSVITGTELPSHFLTPEIIQFLKEKKYKNVFMYAEDKNYLLDLLDLNAGIDVSDILNWCPQTSVLWQDNEFLNLLINKDRYSVQQWLIECSFDKIPEDVFLRLITVANERHWDFSEQQLTFIETQFKCSSLSDFNNKATMKKYIQLMTSLIGQKRVSIDEKYTNECTIYDPEAQEVTGLKNYTLLHLCLVLDEDSLALSLLEQGFDYKAQATVSSLTTKNITPVELAQSRQLTSVVNAIQLREARLYLERRTFQDDYVTKISFFGYTLVNFGFSKREKINAVNALIAYLENGEPIAKSHEPALSQGRLGKISGILCIKYKVDYDPEQDHKFQI